MCPLTYFHILFWTVFLDSHQACFLNNPEVHSVERIPVCLKTHYPDCVCHWLSLMKRNSGKDLKLDPELRTGTSHGRASTRAAASWHSYLTLRYCSLQRIVKTSRSATGFTKSNVMETFCSLYALKWLNYWHDITGIELKSQFTILTEHYITGI